jgi:hypothetical protein
MKIEFCGYILKNPQVLNFMKIGPVEANLFHVDGRTDRHTYSRTYSYDEANSCVSQCTTNKVISSWMRAQLLNRLCCAA